MADHCTPELFKAIDNLERRYPNVFNGRDTYKLEDVVPPLDPDFRVIKDFRDVIRENDWKKYHSDRGLATEIASCLHRYMGIHEIAEYLDMDAKVIGNVIRETPELKKLANKRRTAFTRVVVYDRKTNKYTILQTLYSAAHKVGLNMANFKFYINDRHCKYWINDRFKAKRKVWFDEDNGM